MNSEIQKLVSIFTPNYVAQGCCSQPCISFWKLPGWIGGLHSVGLGGWVRLPPWVRVYVMPAAEVTKCSL